MAKKNYDELIEQNETSFPDNDSGEITEEALRDFHTDMLDSIALETDWLDITDLLLAGLATGGSVGVRRCLVKRTGDVILMKIDGTIAITNASTFTGMTFDLDESISGILGDELASICVFASAMGNFFQLAAGGGNIVIVRAVTSLTATSRDSFMLHVAFPFFNYKSEDIGG
jgi:hypothetical protein